MKRVFVSTLAFAMLCAAGVASAAIKVEAEAYSGEGGGSVSKASDRPGTSGGVCVTGHNNAGHWLEWTVDVPETGEYVIAMRYAGGRKWTVTRELLVDGKSPGEAFAKISFPTTGGFGRAAGEWRNLTVSGADGKPVSVKLDKGSHVIRLNNLGGEGGDGAANMDALWIAKPGEELSI